MAEDDFVGLDQRRRILIKEEYRVPQAKRGSWYQFWGSARVSVAHGVDTIHNARGLKRSGCDIEACGIYIDDERLTKDEAKGTIGWELGMA